MRLIKRINSSQGTTIVLINALRKEEVKVFVNKVYVNELEW